MEPGLSGPRSGRNGPKWTEMEKGPTWENGQNGARWMSKKQHHHD